MEAKYSRRATLNNYRATRTCDFVFLKPEANALKNQLSALQTYIRDLKSRQSALNEVFELMAGSVVAQSQVVRLPFEAEYIELLYDAEHLFSRIRRIAFSYLTDPRPKRPDAVQKPVVYAELHRDAYPHAVQVAAGCAVQLAFDYGDWQERKLFIYYKYRVDGAGRITQEHLYTIFGSNASAFVK